jgi:hypothetical protein
MSASEQILTQEDLAKATGYSRAADIRRCLERQGVRVYAGRGGRVWTTAGALAGAAAGSEQRQQTVEFA